MYRVRKSADALNFTIRVGVHATTRPRLPRFALVILGIALFPIDKVQAEALLAGAAKIDITDESRGPANDRLYVRALVMQQGQTQAALVTVDAVAIGEIGPIDNGYLERVRAQVNATLGIPRAQILANASHCHGLVVPDVDQRTIKAIQLAHSRLQPVAVGVGIGHEDRIMENRRLRMANGREIDVRHAYSLPPDEEVVGVGPIDPEIGVLRLDDLKGRTLAIVYNFACHPIQGVPNGGNTADLTGFASRVIEENLGPNTIALFVQGCGGDINPVFYKDVDHPRDAETLGNLLGLSTLRAVRRIKSQTNQTLAITNSPLTLPRADVAQKITELESQRTQLARSLRGTSLNLKTFLPLVMKYKLSEEFPSYYSHRYIHDDALGRDDLRKLDAENRRNLERYIQNIRIMERLTRLNTNLALLKKHQSEFVKSGKRTLDVELAGLRVGDFVLVTFPGELTVKIGLNIKAASPHPQTFVAGYTNGYIYYAPTTQQLLNVGNAQEDSDCILAPDWQPIFEEAAAKTILNLLDAP